MAEPSTAPRASSQSPAGFSAILSDIIPILSFVRRWWLLGVGMSLLTLATTLAIVIFQGVEYQVSTALFYKLGTELGPPPTMAKDPIVITRRAEDVNNEIEILTSPDLIHNVIQDLGEEFFTAPPATTTFGKFKHWVKKGMSVVTDAIQESMIQAGLRRRLSMLEKIELAVNRSLKVELVRESDVISLTLDTPNPDAGVIIVRKLLDAYQARHLAVHQELAVKEILTRQTNDLRQQLASSTEELLAFQKAADLWSPDDQQKLLLENRKVQQMQVAATGARLANVGKYVEELDRAIALLPEEIELSRSQQINPAIVSLQDKVSSLSLNLAVVETAYRPNAKESIDRRHQIQDLQERIRQERELVGYSTSTGLNVMRQDLSKEHAVKRAELIGLQNQLAAEERQLTETSEALQTLGASIAKYQYLEREHRLLEVKYALYTENFEKADIAAMMNLSKISNIELISPPVASMEPIRPRLLFVVAIGALAGLLLAFIMAILFDLRAAARLRTA